ncbi:MAG TPA: TIGR01777 family oxidoreductase, partial [Allocoleopsis sp.]
MKIAITGSTGFVGTRLVEKLQSQAEQIIIFVRNKNKAENLFPKSKFPDVEIVLYNALESGLWQDKINGCDVVINLAGEPIAERWTPEYKKAIMDSRKLGTEKIVEAISKANIKPSVLINSSAIGYYGISDTADFTEESPSGKDFLAEVCTEWEKAAKKAEEIGTRVVILRTGIVLGMGGAIAKMLTPFKLFTGGTIGSGRQWVSWIHRDDLINLILFSMKNS